MLSHLHYYYHIIIYSFISCRFDGLFGYLRELYDNLMQSYCDFKQWTDSVSHQTKNNGDYPSIDGIVEVLTTSVMLGVQCLLKREKKLPVITQGKSFSISL